MTLVPTSAPQTADWGAVYLGIGRLLGGLAAIATFIGSWIYCVATYGFLVGVCLGWLPALIVALIVGAAVAYLWGLAALGLLVWAISASNHHQSQAQAPNAVVQAATADATTPAAVAVPVQETAPLAPPPPPSVAAANRAADDFQRAYQSGGMGAVVSAVMDCYNKLSGSRDWETWDYCASLDQLGGDASQMAQYPTEFFAAASVQRRQSDGAYLLRSDSAANGDRIAALKAVLEEAFQDRAKASQAALVAAANQPSFDCSAVKSANLKLICATPVLAQADQEMAGAYQVAMSKAPSPTVLRQSQREWVIRRNSAPADVQTLMQLYQARTTALRALVTPNASTDQPAQP